MQNPPPDQQDYGYNTPYNPPPSNPLTPPPGGGSGGGPHGKTSLGLDANIAAMLCYITMILCGLGIIVSLVFFLVEKTSRFVRFHAMQALLLVAANIVISFVLRVFGGILGGGFFSFGLSLLISLGFLVLYIIAGIKAYQGDMYKLPVVGDIAENIAGK
jgi:uncharacterized membrane protein